ncbi:MAG: gamma carbonic anhydrase family protein [Deltaproteobacteria bacterium]|nr:gamma carbonic anhydrase family protein [Deltaproteobacteria bacterium]
MAESAFVHESAVLIGDVQLAGDVSVWPHVTLRGDEGKIRIGEGTNVQDGTTVHMTGGLSHTLVGAHVTVGHHCVLHGCRVGDGALLGMGSIILDNAVIGEGALIGAGSLVTQNKEIPAHCLAFGNPAKVIRELTPSEREDLAESWRHYVEQAQRYRARRGAGE